ncbi:mediator of RNA polymerase II transcription subunit 15-like [Dreissena polymorpha]|uniref:mediator of RNA polymerase II transcription subunit 15-like n=1 Tax=Dreissena polymorpha TaxID=45954 RepID=UPI002263DBD7|nr:mediator of RNA polymerase II transcription subunit 15-like [Dreissena polymorpha]
MSMMTSPTPQIVPSPRQPGSMPTSVPSPSNMLNTPGNPGSVGAAPSPADPSNDPYLEKLKSLSIYLEPLRRMIKKSEDAKGSATEQRQQEINKLLKLHEILTNPVKRVSLETLMKCEQALERMTKFTSTPVVQPPPVMPQVHMCQPLLDSVGALITSSTFNHTLQKTFGPAMSAIFGNPIRVPSPPPKRRCVEVKSSIPDILQGELARLDPRFNVKLDPMQHAGSHDIHLVCRLDDDNLPGVPPILITVPNDYPSNSPECSMVRKDYEGSPFLLSIQRSLVSHLVDLPSIFNFTSLLNMWEMSVRKACAPNS